MLVLHKQNCGVLIQNQTKANTNLMSFSGSQKRKFLLYFTLLVAATFGPGGVLLLSAGDGSTGKQRSPHIQKGQTQNLFVCSRGCAGSLQRHSQGTELPAHQQPALRAGRTPSRDLLAAPPSELPCRNTQSTAQNLLTAKNISNYNS